MNYVPRWQQKALMAGLLFFGWIQAGSSIVHNLVDCAPLLTKEPFNLGMVKDQIKVYRDSGFWQEALECVAQQAISELVKIKTGLKNKKLAIVFDIDETLLSNWDFIVRTDFGYNRNYFKRWERSSQAYPIEPVKKIFDKARALGIAIFCITSRREDQREATENNLIQAGFIGFTAVYYKPMDYTGTSAVKFKSGWRQYIVDQGYTIVMSVGDQISDLRGIPQALINVKLPNPMYFIP